MYDKVVNMAGIGGQLAPEGWSASTSIYTMSQNMDRIDTGTIDNAHL